MLQRPARFLFAALCLPALAGGCKRDEGERATQRAAAPQPSATAPSAALPVARPPTAPGGSGPGASGSGGQAGGSGAASAEPDADPVAPSPSSPEGARLGALLSPLLGAWVSEAYVALLKAKRSPRVAQSAAPGPAEIAFLKGEQSWQLHMDLGLHEGIELPILSGQGKRLEVLAIDFDDGGVKKVRRVVEIDGPSHVRYAGRGYVPVGTAAPGATSFEEAVTALVLGGEYEGSDGKAYAIGPGRKGMWAGKPARVTVQYDMGDPTQGIDPPFDALWVELLDGSSAQQGALAFRFVEGGKVAIHKLAAGKVRTTIESRPDVVLTLAPRR